MKAASTFTMVRLSEDDRRIFTTLGLAIPESAETFPAASVAGKAFRRLSLKCHPDKNPSPEARDEFEALQQAYDQVVNEDKSEALKARLFGPDVTSLRTADMEAAMQEQVAAAAQLASELRRREQEAAEANRRTEHEGKHLQDGLRKLFYDSATAIEDEMIQQWEVDQWGLVQDKEEALLQALLKRPREL